MTVHKVAGDDAGGYADYLAATPDVSRRGDYYLGRDGEPSETPGKWHGRGAEALGLRGNVTRENLLAAWDGRDPSTGAVTIHRAAGGEHVAAVDCTFSAPKSVSVVWATSDLAHREELEGAQTSAVHAALDHIENVAPLTRRRTPDGLIHERSDGLVAAIFRHHTSRLSAEQEDADAVPDPQLHDHATIANMALRPADVRKAGHEWAAIDSRELFRIAAEAGAVYRTELAHRLQLLGYEVERAGRYFEITGVSEAVRDTFSQRTRDVQKAREQFVETYGRTPTIAELKALTLRTRGAKLSDPGDPFPTWKRRAEDAGFTSEATRNTERGVHAEPDVNAATRTVVTEVTSLTDDRSLVASSAVFDTRQLRIAVAEASQGRVSGSDVELLIESVMQSKELLRLEDQHWTTRAIRTAEEEVLRRSREAHTSRRSSASTAHVDAAIADARVPLSAEQRHAARALSGPSGFQLLTAPAGAGKGEVLRAVAAAHHSEGHRVIALAAAGETAQRLGKEIGADRAWTIDGFIGGVREGVIRVRPNDVVIADEAALVETMRWRDLLRATESAKVIAAGDPAQLSPIEAGGMWRVVEREIGAHRLTENYRAREGWAAEAWKEVRHGSVRDGLQALADRGLFHLAETRADARYDAVALWDCLRQSRNHGTDRPSVLLLTDSTNREVDMLNEAAQQRRIDAGELGEKYVEVIARDRPGATVRQERLHVSDEVVLRCGVLSEDGTTIGRNGSTGRISHVDPINHRVGVELESGDTLTLQGQDVSAVRLGYARHVYSAQGRTVDHTVSLFGGRQTARDSLYVGTSRARDESHVVTSLSTLGLPKERSNEALAVLAKQAERSEPKIASLDFEPAITTKTTSAPTWPWRRSEARDEPTTADRNAADRTPDVERQVDSEAEATAATERARMYERYENEVREREHEREM